VRKPRLLDLFCKAGGCTKGYQRAGFYVVGVDIEPQPNYCGDEFYRQDALRVLSGKKDYPEGGGMVDPDVMDIWYQEWCRLDLSRFDAIHASPPCQAHSTLSRMWNARADHPTLIEPVRELLEATGLPYVIENVVGAPLRNAVQLCGSSLGLPLLQRHRLFETNFPMMAPPCAHNQGEKRFPALDAEGRRKGGRSSIVGVYGHGGDKRADLWPEAMGIDWMTRHELTQAIPPAYTEFIGHYLLNAVEARHAA
jgi:DNA (cytosine-5)-methyltransferase 1